MAPLIDLRLVVILIALLMGAAACSAGQHPTCDPRVNVPFIQQLGVTENEFIEAFSVRWQGPVWLVALTGPRTPRSRTGVWVTDVAPRGAFAPVDRATILPVNEEALRFSTVIQAGRIHPVSEAYEVAADTEAVAFAARCFQTYYAFSGSPAEFALGNRAPSDKAIQKFRVVSATISADQL